MLNTEVQSTLRRLEVNTRYVQFNVNALRVYVPMGVNDMHATHVVAKIMYVYVQLHLLL